MCNRSKKTYILQLIIESYFGVYKDNCICLFYYLEAKGLHRSKVCSLHLSLNFEYLYVTTVRSLSTYCLFLSKLPAGSGTTETMRRIFIRVAVCICTASLVTNLANGCEDRKTRFRPDATPSTCELVEPDKRLCSLQNAASWNTSYPNIFNHSSHREASKFLTDFQSFIQSGCSDHLSRFICYAVFPLCHPASGFHRVEPCQEMCVAVRENCSKFLQSNGMTWLAELNCNKFPPHGSKLCIWDGKNCTPSSPKPASSLGSYTARVRQSVTRKSIANCTGHLVPHPNHSNTRYGGIDNCGERCEGVYLTQEEKDFNTVWIAIWSLLCLLISIVTVLTWVINNKAIKSPESLVYYIALCYSFVAISYTISIAIGEDSIICDSTIKNFNNESALIVNGLHSPLCITLFSVTYFFTLATWVWWALLNLEWLICSVKSTAIGMKWRICSQLVGWGVPVLFLLIALGTESVSGNPILGTCWISKGKEVAFLIAPLLTIIIFSSIVILTAFTRVTKLQRAFKDVDLQKEELDRITTGIQVSLYSTVYLIPMGVLVCCYWYEYCFRQEWEESYIRLHQIPANIDSTEPIFNVLKMKFAVSLIMGIMSGAWTFRKSSTRAWRRVCCVCCLWGRQQSLERSQLHTVRQIHYTEDQFTARLSFSETSV